MSHPHDHGHDHPHPPEGPIDWKIHGVKVIPGDQLDAKTGAHHHGHLESVIYVVKGRARMRWGEKLEFTAEAGPGDFIFVPPYVPHQEINPSPGEMLNCVVARSGQEPIVVNLDIAPA